MPDPTAPDTLPTAAPTAGRRVLWIALAAYPLTALVWLSWTVLTRGVVEAGFLDYVYALYVAGIAAMIVPLPVLIWAGRRRRLGPALLGLCLGGVIALAAGPLSLHWIGERRIAQFQQRKERFAQFEQTVRGHDRARIRAALHALPDRLSPAHALCALGGNETYVFPRWFLMGREIARGTSLPSADLLVAARAVSEGDWPRAQTQAALMAVLSHLARRGEPQHFAAWAELWRATLAPGAKATLDKPAFYGEYACTVSDPAALVFGHWHEDGLRVWLQAGFAFAPGQHTPALQAVRSTAMLDRLLASDGRFAELLRDDPLAGRAALWSQANGLSQRLDRSADPLDAATVIERLRAAGAVPDRTSPPMPPCQMFEREEALERPTPIAAAARAQAVQRIRAALCPPAPAEAPSTGPAPAPTQSSAHSERL